MTFFESLNISLAHMVTILMASAKLATLGFVKIMVFWNKCDDVVISVDDVTNKVLSGESNYTANV